MFGGLFTVMQEQCVNTFRKCCDTDHSETDKWTNSIGTSEIWSGNLVFYSHNYISGFLSFFKFRSEQKYKYIHVYHRNLFWTEL